jgi:hypothetical protein
MVTLVAVYTLVTLDQLGSLSKGGIKQGGVGDNGSTYTCNSALYTIHAMTILRSLRYTLLATLLTSHLVLGTALTAILNAHERSCYYADVDGVGEKIG